MRIQRTRTIYPSSLAFILAVLLFTAGCRSRTDQQPTSEIEPATVPAAATTGGSAIGATTDPRPLLVCFGDSLTAGFGTDPGQSYPDYLQADLDAKGFHYHVLNEGVSGATSKDGITRLPEILALKPAVIVVEFGGNDGLRGLPVKDIRTNLDQIVSTLKTSGAKIAVAGITLPPDYGPDYVTQFTALYPALAKKYQVPVLPFLLQGVYGVDGMMQEDRTHATAQGNKIVANNVLPIVEPLLKK